MDYPRICTNFIDYWFKNLNVRVTLSGLKYLTSKLINLRTGKYLRYYCHGNAESKREVTAFFELCSAN